MPLDPARITPPRRGLLLLEARALLELAALVPAYPFLRRTATCDTELAGKRIAQGDKLAMWYVSATRDEDVFERPNEFRIDRENARDHLAFLQRPDTGCSRPEPPLEEAAVCRLATGG